jgi:hypothetical protein
MRLEVGGALCRPRRLVLPPPHRRFVLLPPSSSSSCFPSFPLIVSDPPSLRLSCRSCTLAPRIHPRAVAHGGGGGCWLLAASWRWLLVSGVLVGVSASLFPCRHPPSFSRGWGRVVGVVALRSPPVVVVSLPHPTPAIHPARSCSQAWGGILGHSSWLAAVLRVLGVLVLAGGVVVVDCTHSRSTLRAEARRRGVCCPFRG